MGNKSALRWIDLSIVNLDGQQGAARLVECLLGILGIREAKANVNAGMARVEYDPLLITVEQIRLLGST